MNNVPIENIKVGNRLRPLGDFSDLAESIRAIGLCHPITVSCDFTLIAGMHRLCACKHLGWQDIPAIVVDVSPVEAELIEIDENIVRSELTYQERILALKRRKEIYERLYPQATKSSKSAANLSGTTISTSSFSEATAKLMGNRSLRSIQDDLRIAVGIIPEVHDVVRGTPMANSRKDLAVLSKKSPEDQKVLVEHIQSGVAKTMAEAASMVRRQLRDSTPEEAEPIEGEDFIFSAGMQKGDFFELIDSYPAGSVKLFLTDPPYNVSKDTWDEQFDVPKFMVEVARLLSDDGSALIFCSDLLLPEYMQNRAGLLLKQILHWHKTNRNPIPVEGPTGINKYLSTIEYILWFTKSDSYAFNPRRANTDICGDTKTDLFRTTQCGGGERFKNAEGKTLHKCQKPYDLIETLLLTHSNRGDRVMDPFLGTGTTAEAAVRWERKFWGIERDPEYFARARDRATSVLGWTFPNKNEDFEDDYA